MSERRTIVPGERYHDDAAQDQDHRLCEWRTGRRLGRTVYAVTGEDWLSHPLIGVMDTPELATEAMLTHNAWLAQDERDDPVLDAVYAERNALVLAFAHMAELEGWQVGKAVDADEPDWPVLLIDTPEGQVSWHFKADELPPTVPDYPGKWDGHDTPEKYERLKRLVGRAWGPGR